jgi:hypothetical protein
MFPEDTRRTFWGGKTLVAGSLFDGVSFTWLALANGFLGFVVFELLAAVGVALFSGTDVALLYASLDPRSEGGGQDARAIGSLLFRLTAWRDRGRAVRSCARRGP